MKNVNFHPLGAGVFLSLIFTIFIFPFALQAAPSDLDPTFGTGGKVVTDFRSYSDSDGSLALQPDGKLVAAGYSWNGPTGGSSRTDFALARYNVDGSLDATFGIGGKVLTDFNGDNDSASSVVIQPDGKILAGGSAVFVGVSRPSGFALARYNPDGSLDLSFGVGGKVTTIFSGVEDAITGIALQPDGKIVAAGYRYVSPLAVFNDYDIALARYNPDGTIDPTFGSGGSVFTSFASFNNETASGVEIQSDGHIAVVGKSGNNNSFQSFIVARYTANGSFDGYTTPSFTPPSYNSGTDITIQSDGKILAVGIASSNLGVTTRFAVARLNADLTSDMTFGVGGKVTTECGTNSKASSVAVQTNDRVVVTGGSCMARYNPDGTLDATFGVGGILIDSVSPIINGAAVRIQSDGKIVKAGNVPGGPFGFAVDFGLARYVGDPIITTTTTTTSTTTTTRPTTTTTTTSTTTTTNCNDNNKGKDKNKGKGGDKGKCKGHKPDNDKSKDKS